MKGVSYFTLKVAMRFCKMFWGPSLKGLILDAAGDTRCWSNQSS
jgi:hypothetical protein